MTIRSLARVFPVLFLIFPCIYVIFLQNIEKVIAKIFLLFRIANFIN